MNAKIETKFTPGPWKCKGINNYGYGVVGSVDQNGVYHTVAQTSAAWCVDSEGCEPKERGLANARLIAGAPEMLEALEKTLKFIDKDPQLVRDIVKQAIQKATQP